MRFWAYLAAITSSSLVFSALFMVQFWLVSDRAAMSASDWISAVFTGFMFAVPIFLAAVIFLAIPYVVITYAASKREIHSIQYFVISGAVVWTAFIFGCMALMVTQAAPKGTNIFAGGIGKAGLLELPIALLGGAAGGSVYWLVAYRPRRLRRLQLESKPGLEL